MEHPGSQSAAPPSRTPLLVRACWRGLLVSCGALLVAGTLSRFSVYYAWDDAYMFVRYADNLLATGVLSWNPGGGATYGLTSPLYLSVVLPLRLALPHSPALVIVLASVLCGAVFVWLALVLAVRAARASGAVSPAWMALFVLFALALAHVPLTAHFVSGMDTAFALAWGAAYILLARRVERGEGLREAALLGAWGGLSYFARPELLLYAFAVPGVMALAPHRTGARRRAAVALAVTAAVLGAQVGLAALLLGSPLPLPFYAKSLRIYGEAMYASYRAVPGRELVAFLRSHWPLLAAVAAGMALRPAALLGRGRPVNRGLFLATALLLAYEARCVLQIMYYHQRFYYPALPALLYLAVEGVGACGGRLRRRARAPLAVLAVVGSAALFAPFVAALSSHWNEGQPGRHMGRFDLRYGYRARWRHLWYRLDAVSALPDDLAIATTEVGLPAVLSPGREIVDLSGLNNPAIARHGFSADALFRAHSPGLFYMPHADNRRMDEQIREHPVFREHYDHYSRERLGTLLGVAIDRRSPHYPALHALLEGAGTP